MVLLRTALKSYERDLAEHPGVLIAIQDVALCHKRIGAVLAVQKKTHEALDEYSTALKLDEQAIQLQPADLELELNLTYTLSDHSLMLWRLGKNEGSSRRFCEKTRHPEEIVKRDAANACSYKLSLATILKRYGDLLAESDAAKIPEAFQHLERAAALYRATLRDPESSATLASTEGSIGDLLARPAIIKPKPFPIGRKRLICISAAAPQMLTDVDQEGLRTHPKSAPTVKPLILHVFTNRKQQSKVSPLSWDTTSRLGYPNIWSSKGSLQWEAARSREVSNPIHPGTAVAYEFSPNKRIAFLLG